MDSARAVVVELFRQIIEGDDIPAPSSLLKGLTPEKVSRSLPDRPYSILTNLAHADFWQQLWLDRLRGKKVKSITLDWKTPPPETWRELRVSFQTGLELALAIARSEPFEHKMKSDEIAIRTLLQIAIHDSYHLGQINLLKRELRLATSRARSG